MLRYPTGVGMWLGLTGRGGQLSWTVLVSASVQLAKAPGRWKAGEPATLPRLCV